MTIHKPKLVGNIDKSQKHSREAWVKACDFQPVSEGDVVQEMANAVLRRLAESNGKVVVLLDLDSTLYEVQPRTFKILREWIAHKSSHEHRRLREIIAEASLDKVGYSLGDTVRMNGVDPTHNDVVDSIKELSGFWRERFFTSEYLQHDLPYENAVDCVKTMHELGADIIYLTGRDQPGMGEGTRSCLKRDGFPFDMDRTHLLLKSTFTQDDLSHKKNASQFVKDMGTLVASMENEPRNLVALYEAFPDGMHIYFDTVCSEAPAHPCSGIYKMKHFPVPGA